MQAFIVKLEHRPGSMADLAEALGEKGINITGISAVGWDASGAVGLITSDEGGTRSVLDQRDADYREAELVAAALEDRPGQLGVATRRLAEVGINIEAIIPTGMSSSGMMVAFAVDDPSAAREALGQLAAVGSQPV
ncbi:MAG: hypothetical protein ACRDG7_06910 [Candidatus Limnocylindria bacterium]